MKEEQIPVIFMTSHERKDLFEYALEAEPCNYLQKPFTGLQLKQAIELALVHTRRKQEREKKQFVFFKDTSKMLVKVPVSQIYLIESFGNYCHFYTLSGRYTHRMALKNYADFISSAAFIRINRNNVVNVNFVSSVDRSKQKVNIKNRELALSRRYRSDLIKALPDGSKLF
jgi:DNA-binding LytR/AlgR family response regulator